MARFSLLATGLVFNGAILDPEDGRSTSDIGTRTATGRLSASATTAASSLLRPSAQFTAADDAHGRELWALRWDEAWPELE